jgi:hypothetical protein
VSGTTIKMVLVDFLKPKSDLDFPDGYDVVFRANAPTLRH